MKVIGYKYRTADGKIRSGEMRVAAIGDLHTSLASRSEILLEITGIREDSGEAFALSSKDLLELFETIGNLTTSGLRVQNAIEIALELPFTGNLGKVIAELHQKIQKGQGFAQAFSATVKRVPALISGMLHIGERSGQLDRVVQHCTTYLRMMQGLREKMVSASTYPGFILVLLAVGVSLLLFVFIPSLQNGLSSMKGQAAAIGAGYDRVRVLLLGLLVIISIPIGTVIFYRWSRAAKPDAAAALESLAIKVPTLGEVMSASQLFSLSFTLEVLLDSGVPLQEALTLCQKTIWSIAYQELLGDAAKLVKDGMALSAALGRHKILPVYFVRWIGIAERTGRAGQVFSQLRIYYQKQLDVMIARMTSLIEPVMIASVGIILMAVISAVVLPLFSMYSIKV